jgi:hypothetical protein
MWLLVLDRITIVTRLICFDVEQNYAASLPSIRCLTKDELHV